MKQTQETLRKEDSTKQPALYIAFELGNVEWKMAFSEGSTIRYVSIDARKLYQVEREIERARKHFGLSEGIPIVSCYEAGRDGFWLHRYLMSTGIENLVVDSSSIEVNRRRRRAKTDRLDAGKLFGMLQRYVGGEQRAWRVVRVPTEQTEDERNIGRELDVLHSSPVNIFAPTLTAIGAGYFFIDRVVILEASHALHFSRYKTETQLRMFRRRIFADLFPMCLQGGRIHVRRSHRWQCAELGRVLNEFH